MVDVLSTIIVDVLSMFIVDVLAKELGARIVVGDLLASVLTRISTNHAAVMFARFTIDRIILIQRKTRSVILTELPVSVTTRVKTDATKIELHDVLLICVEDGSLRIRMSAGRCDPETA